MFLEIINFINKSENDFKCIKLKVYHHNIYNHYFINFFIILIYNYFKSYNFLCCPCFFKYIIYNKFTFYYYL